MAMGQWQQCAIYSSENTFTASPPFKAIASFFTSLNIKRTFSSGAYKQEAAHRDMQGNPSNYQSTTQFDDWYHCRCSGASATPVASTTRNATTPMSPASPTPSAISARASSSPTALESVSEFFSGPSSSSGGNHIRRFSISSNLSQRKI